MAISKEDTARSYKGTVIGDNTGRQFKFKMVGTNHISVCNVSLFLLQNRDENNRVRR